MRIELSLMQAVKNSSVVDVFEGRASMGLPIRQSFWGFRMRFCPEGKIELCMKSPGADQGGVFVCLFFLGRWLEVPGRHFLLTMVPQGAKMELFWSHFSDFVEPWRKCEN